MMLLKEQMKAYPFSHNERVIIDYILDKQINIKDYSVKMIADEFGLSEGYLSKLFKESLGATVKEYLSRVRLWHAEEQLVETDYPVIDIAIGNGFPNVKSFNQAFKRKNVITPAKYREKMRK